MTLERFVELFPSFRFTRVIDPNGLYIIIEDTNSDAKHEVTIYNPNHDEKFLEFLKSEEMEKAIVMDACREMELAQHNVDLLIQEYDRKEGQ